MIQKFKYDNELFDTMDNKETILKQVEEEKLLVYMGHDGINLLNVFGKVTAINEEHIEVKILSTPSGEIVQGLIKFLPEEDHKLKITYKYFPCFQTKKFYAQTTFLTIHQKRKV